jgi:cobalt-zinc-cadmium efflux system membrane fusion protein
VFVRSAEGFTAHPVSVIGKQGDDSTIKGPFIGTEIIAEKGAVSLKANWLGLGSEE